MKKRAQQLGFKINKKSSNQPKQNSQIKSNQINKKQYFDTTLKKAIKNEQIQDNLRKKLHQQSIDIDIYFNKTLNYLQNQKITPAKSQFTTTTQKITNFQSFNNLNNLEQIKQQQNKNQNINNNNYQNTNNNNNDEIKKPHNNSEQKTSIKQTNQINNNQISITKISLDPFQQKNKSHHQHNNNNNNSSLICQKLFSLQQNLLISIQQKLDDYLSFLKLTRNHKRGQYFYLIRNNFKQNHRLIIQFKHLKKIYFICEQLYNIQKGDSALDNDCYVDIKGKLTSKQRKDLFKNKLENYVLIHKNKENQKIFKIPQYKFDFQQQLEQCKKLLTTTFNSIFQGQLMSKTKKVDPLFTLYSKDSQIYKQNSRLLQERIKKVQKYVQSQNQLKYKIFQDKMFTSKNLNQKQLYKIIDQMVLYYLQKNVATMRLDEVILHLCKKIMISQEMLKKVIQIFLEMSKQLVNELTQKNQKSQLFLQSIKHKQGDLLKICKSSVEGFKRFVVSEAKISRFVFETEMNEKQKVQMIKNIARKQESQQNKTVINNENVKSNMRQNCTGIQLIC